MRCYRMVQNRSRALDLSGGGASKYGGRWNSKGTSMLYCSENSSLAYLENLVHFEAMCMPSNLFVVELTVSMPSKIHTLSDYEYPENWMALGSMDNRKLGDRWMADTEFLGFRVRSAINRLDFNILLNPIFPGFQHMVNITQVHELEVDGRL